jgi:rSAM/selenodomain-associated transferase 2
MRISVIVPTLNEAANLPRTLACLQRLPELEIIVADGGSQDQTIDIAQACGAQVIQTQPGRSTQMNQAAKHATGEVLLFLHADTRLPDDWLKWVAQTLKNPDMIAGAFELTIDSPQWGLRWIEWGVKWRSRLLQLPYGDQAIFLRAATFEQLGGFPDLGIMEDFVFVRQLQQRGRIAIVPVAVQTSARRWQSRGLWQTTLINQTVLLGYHLGISPDRLRGWYRGGRQAPHQTRPDKLH